MSLLNWFRRKDPTEEWPPARAVPLRFDIDRGELNGIPFGAPMNALQALGRPSNPRAKRDYQWSYPSLGLEVAQDSSARVNFFTCVLQADENETDLSRYPEFQPCRLSLRLADGTEFQVTPHTPRAEIEAVLGPLTREGGDEVGMDTATCGSAWFGFSFDGAGRWTLLDIEPAPRG
ncbi:MAG: hypothetical protein KY444_02770 [Gemmatimonadetes bacterium]|nr:hypothetical protein [Gemmatimonadota bacterium]